MKIIQDIAGMLFIVAVAILSAISVLGVWKIFTSDVITKSFETIGILAIVAVVIMIAGRLINAGSSELPNPIFKNVRHTTLAVLIICVSILALLGVLAIWDVIVDKDILYKSLSSLAILAFGAFVMVLTCLERENNPLLTGGSTSGRSWTIGGIIGILIFVYLLFSLGRLLWH